MKFQYIFWDNDGVLVDTERLYYQACREALAQIGVTLTHRDFVTISLTQGRTVFDLATEQGSSTNDLRNLREWRNKRYMQLLGQGDLVLPKVRETLLQLHKEIGMAIVTSSHRDHFERIHRDSNLLPFFDFVLTREDYAQSKPDPEPYLLALANSRQAPGDCLVIEDSPRGLAAAKAAGLTCWVIPSIETYQQDFSAADRILEKISDLPSLLK